MSTRLGALQSRLLAGLQAHGAEVCLEHVVYFAEGLAELDDRFYWRKSPKPTASTYKSCQRAITGLRRRGLVKACLVGSRRYRSAWDRDASGALIARRVPSNPTTALWVRAVETSPPGGTQQ